MVNLMFNIPPKLKAEFKIQCMVDGKSMRQKITEMIEKSITDDVKKIQKTKVAESV